MLLCYVICTHTLFSLPDLPNPIWSLIIKKPPNQLHIPSTTLSEIIQQLSSISHVLTSNPVIANERKNEWRWNYLRFFVVANQIILRVLQPQWTPSLIPIGKNDVKNYERSFTLIQPMIGGNVSWIRLNFFFSMYQFQKKREQQMAKKVLMKLISLVRYPILP